MSMPPPPPGPGSFGPGHGAEPVPQPAPATLEPLDAISYGWKAFTKNAGPFLGLTAIVLAVSFALSLLGVILDGGLDELSDPSSTSVQSGPMQSLLNLV